MFKRIVFLSFVVLVCRAGAQQNLAADRKSIKQVIAKANDSWVNRDYDAWTSAWHKSSDVIVAIVSASGYSETKGWKEYSPSDSNTIV